MKQKKGIDDDCGCGLSCCELKVCGSVDEPPSTKRTTSQNLEDRMNGRAHVGRTMCEWITSIEVMNTPRNIVSASETETKIMAQCMAQCMAQFIADGGLKAVTRNNSKFKEIIINRTHL